MSKGIYGIMTTFFFIIMALIVALGVVYYNVMIGRMSTDFDNGLEKYVHAQNVRDSLFYCYGDVLDEQLVQIGQCRNGQMVNISQDIAKGYRIRRLPLQGCPAANWTNPSSIPQKYREQFVFAVPVTHNATHSCLGLLEVYI